MVKNIMRQAAVILITALGVHAQYVAAPTSLINTPTVATLSRGGYVSDIRFTTDGGVLAGLQVGFTDRFLIGLSYGGAQIIGNKIVNWNPDPGVSVKYHLVDETRMMPGFSVGFNSQGYGAYRDSYYEISSPGFYLVGSKNWMLIGNTSLHGGLNYSMEQPGDKKYPSFFLGASLELNPQFAFMIEYDAALNYENADYGSADSLDFRISRGYGFLNAGFRVGLSDNIFVEVDFNNLMWSDRIESPVESFNRELKLIFFDSF